MATLSGCTFAATADPLDKPLTEETLAALDTNRWLAAADVRQLDAFLEAEAELEGRPARPWYPVNESPPKTLRAVLSSARTIGGRKMDPVTTEAIKDLALGRLFPLTPTPRTSGAAGQPPDVMIATMRNMSAYGVRALRGVVELETVFGDSLAVLPAVVMTPLDPGDSVQLRLRVPRTNAGEHQYLQLDDVRWRWRPRVVAFSDGTIREVAERSRPAKPR